MARTISFQPSTELGSFIQGLVNSGEYNNQSEVVREALRLLREEKANSSVNMLRALLKEGFDSGLSQSSAEDIKQRVLSKKGLL